MPSQNNLAMALMGIGQQLPSMVRSNRDYARDKELDPLRRMIMEQQAKGYDLTNQKASQEIAGNEIEATDRQSVKDALASTVDAFGRQKGYIQHAEDTGNFAPLMNDPRTNPKSMRDLATESGLPTFAGDANVKQFTSDFIAIPEANALAQSKIDKMQDTGLGMTTIKKREDWNKISEMEDGPDKDKAIDDYMMVYAPGTKYPLTGKGISEKVGAENALIAPRSATAEATSRAGKIGGAEGETVANQTAIPGFETITGTKITDDSVKKVKGAASQIEPMKQMAQRIIDKYNKMGSAFTGDDAADFTSQVLNLQMMAKSEALFNLGVLTGNDYELLQKSIPNPASIKEGVKKQVVGDLSVKLNNFMKLLDDKGSTFYKLNGFQKGQNTSAKKYSDTATQQAKEALNDPSAPEAVKAKARKVLGL
jgi:uncharacterized protein YukE